MRHNGCFLVFYEINDDPKKKQKPVIDLCLSGQAPQSESGKPVNLREGCAEKNKPLPGFSLRYLRILKAAQKCSVVGDAKNWFSLPTTMRYQVQN